MDRRTRYAVGPEDFNDFFCRMLFCPARNHGVQFIFLICPVLIQFKPFIGKPVGMIRRFAEPFPDSIVTDTDDNPFIRCFKRIVRINEFITVACPLRNTAFYHVNFRYGFHGADRAVHQPYIDVFTVMLCIPSLQSCQDADAAVQAAQDVTNSRPRPGWRRIRPASNTHHAAERLGNDIAGQQPVRAGLAKSGY